MNFRDTLKRKQLNERMELLVHNRFRFSNLNNDQLNNKEIADKINLISDIMNHIPSDLQETSKILLSSYLAENNTINVENDKYEDVMLKAAFYHIKKIVNDLGLYDDFISHFKLLNSSTSNLLNNLRDLKDDDGLNVPMYLINKLPSIEQITIFLITYQIIDPEFITYKVEEGKKLSGHSIITYITKKFLEFFKKQTNVKNLDIQFENYQICFIFLLTNIIKRTDKNNIINQIVDKEYTLLDIIDEILLEFYMRCCENNVNPDEPLMSLFVVNRCILEKCGSIKSIFFAHEWTSSIKILSTIIPFPRKEYWNGLRQLPNALKAHYENETNLDLTKFNDDLLQEEINYYNKIPEISLNSLPEISQRIAKMTNISRKESPKNTSTKNIPYFLNQMNVHFLNDSTIIITDELLQQYDLKYYTRIVYFEPGHNYKTKKAALKDDEHVYYYPGKSTIKDFAYDFVRRILSLNDISKKFNVNDDNENEYDKCISDFANISINLPDLKINGFTIPMYIVNQKINNLSSFLAAYEQLDPKFATKTYKRSGDFRGFSVLSFVLHNFLLDIKNINDNLITNYVESIYVILNNLDCRPEQKRLKILCSEKVDNLHMLDSIIEEMNNQMDNTEISSIDKKLSDLNDLRKQYLNSIQKS